MTSKDDGLNFPVTVDGKAGRAELDALLKKIRQLGTEAVASGDKIDKSTVDSAKSYKELADEIADTIRVEQDLQRSVEQTRAARERANAAAYGAKAGASRAQTASVGTSIAEEKLKTQELATQNALREQENRNLIAGSKVSLITDQREAVAEQRQDKAAAKRTKSVQDLQKQQDAAWGRRERDLAAEAAAQKKIDTQVDSAFAERESLRRKDSQQALRDGLAEAATQERIEVATEKRLAAEAAAKRKATLAGTRNDQNNIYNDYLANQAENAPSVANLNATRYALYDIATTAAIVGGAITAIGAYSVVTASKFEYAFASVDRAAGLTGDQVAGVKAQLIDLTTTIPTKFEDVAGIATLGAQMNIAEDDLDSFSSTVSRFSATTNSSIDTTAQSFGRLSNLLDVPASKFENLGSAIALVGVKSVATESEILSTTQQIAGAAAVYGFTADQVVGLGAAFSSLAIAPEAARGSVTRIFGDIEQAVSDGGQAMSEYARILKVDVADAQELWQKDPSAFFAKLVQGLSTSENLLKDIQAVGANDVRDQNLLQRLAGSPEVLNQALAISAQGFQEGTYLAEAYATQTDNLQSKLAVLANTFDALANSAGGPLNEGLKIAVDIITHLLKLVGSAPPWFLALVVGITLVVGAFILLKGAQAAAIAGLLAMQTALKGLSSNAALTGISFKTLNAVLLQTRAMFAGGATSAAGFTTKVKGAAGAVAGFAKGTGVLLLVTAGLEALAFAADKVNYILSSASDKAESYFGDISGFGDAVKADTEAYEARGIAVATYEAAIEKQRSATHDAADGTSTWLGLQQQVPGVADDATSSITGQTVALGENATEWVRNALAQQEGIQQLANDSELRAAFTNFGGNINDFIEAGLKGQGGDYVDTLIANAQAQIDAAYAASGGAVTNQIVHLESDVARLEGVLRPAADATDLLVQGQIEAGNTSDFLAGKLGSTAVGLDEFSDSATGATDKAGELKTQLDGLFDGLNVEGDFYDSIDQLYTALAASGNEFSTFSDEGRSSISALQDSIIDTITYGEQLGISSTDSVLALFLSLQQNGIDTSALLNRLASSPIVYQADIDISALQSKLAAANLSTQGLGQGVVHLNGAINGTASAAQTAAAGVDSYGGAAGGAAEKVKTLTEYSDDLSKVMKNAFDIRFGKQQAFDDITSGWNKVKDATQDARDKLAEYLADLQDMQSQKDILEYQLGVAINFGDTLRAGKIQAELTKLTGQMSEKQKGADDTTASLSKTLAGNSQAAIDNRAEILGLVGDYQDYIKELANSGLSQDQLKQKVAALKQQFLDQATQLGYSRGEVEKFTTSFDDASKIIQELPRDITIKFNADPALRALEEFRVAAEKAGAAAGKVKLPSQQDSAGVRQLALAAQIAAAEAYLKQLIASGNVSGAIKYSDVLGTLRNNMRIGNYAQGGFVPGAVPSNKGVDNSLGVLPGGRTVGLQGGEPIMTNAARAKYGDHFFDQINALQYKPSPVVQMMTNQSRGSDSGMPDFIELGPMTMRELVESFGDQIIQIGDTVIGQATDRYHARKRSNGG